jgi:hypothetical protein
LQKEVHFSLLSPCAGINPWMRPRAARPGAGEMIPVYIERLQAELTLHNPCNAYSLIQVAPTLCHIF